MVVAPIRQPDTAFFALLLVIAVLAWALPFARIPLEFVLIVAFVRYCFKETYLGIAFYAFFTALRFSSHHRDPD